MYLIPKRSDSPNTLTDVELTSQQAIAESLEVAPNRKRNAPALHRPEKRRRTDISTMIRTVVKGTGSAEATQKLLLSLTDEVIKEKASTFRGDYEHISAPRPRHFIVAPSAAD